MEKTLFDTNEGGRNYLNTKGTEVLQMLSSDIKHHLLLLIKDGYSDIEILTLMHYAINNAEFSLTAEFELRHLNALKSQ